MVVEVSFVEWTPDGLLRHVVYLGEREDKPASEVRRAGHLREIGWRVETIWECDTRKAERLAARVAEIVEGLPTAERRRC
jgi:hypothetical protein